MASKLIKFLVFISIVYLMAYLLSFSKSGFLPFLSFLNIHVLNLIVGFFAIFASFIMLLSDILKRKIFLELTDLIVIIAAFIMIAHIYNIVLKINLFNPTLINAIGFLLILPFSRTMIDLLKGEGTRHHSVKKH